MVADWDVAVAVTDWVNRECALHRNVDHDHTVGDWHSARDIFTADTLVKRLNFTIFWFET